MKILIIGGTGVISSAVTKEALLRDIDVYMINRGNLSKYIPSTVKLIKANKNDLSAIEIALNGHYFDAVIDFLSFSAKEVSVSFSFYKAYTKQFIFISTCCVYNSKVSQINSEDSPKVMQEWDYSVNKWAAEETLVNMSSTTDTHYTIIRPAITYGNTRIPYGIAPKYGYHWTIIQRILSEKPLIRWNGGSNRTNMIRVEDFAIGLVGVIGNVKAYNQAFNLCGDETPCFNDVLDTLSKILNRRVKVVDIDSIFYAKHLPAKSGEILGGRSVNSINSNSKIKAIVPDFKQHIYLEEGIKMTYDSYLQNDLYKGIDWEFDGDTDRVIYEWCKLKKINSAQYNLRYIDYLEDNNLRNKLEYYKARYRYSIAAKVIALFKNCLFLRNK